MNGIINYSQRGIKTLSIDDKGIKKKKAASLIEKLLFVWLLKLGSNQRPSD